MNLFNLDVPASSAPAASPLHPAAPGGPPEWLGNPSTQEGGVAAPFGQLLADALRQLPGQDLAAPPGAAPEALEAAVDGVLSDKNHKNEMLDGVGDAGWLTVAWAAQQPRLAGVAGAELQAQPLGTTLQLITPASAPPDDSSLAAFARSQGLDDQATRWLLSLPAGPYGSVVGGAAGAAAGPVNGQGAAQMALLAPQLTGSSGQAPGLGGVALAASPGAVAGMAAGDAPAVAVVAAVAPVAPVANAANAATAANAANVAAVATGLVPASLQLAGLMGGREREPVAAPPTDVPASASVVAGLRKTFLMPGVAASGKAGGGASAPSFVSVPLDLAIDLPEGFEGPDGLDALRAWLEKALPDGGSPTPSAPSAGETAAGRMGALSPSTFVDRSGPAAPDAQQRTEQQQALAQRMGEAMAQRLVAQVERGNWNVRFMLRPQSLGHVEVELQMRSGELEAAFRAPLALTRELLNDSLPRLREVLTQMGMDVAHLHVGARQGQAGGGNSTPRQHTPGQSGSASPERAAPVSDSATRPGRRGLDGWDVLV